MDYFYHYFPLHRTVRHRNILHPTTSFFHVCRSRTLYGTRLRGNTYTNPSSRWSANSRWLFAGCLHVNSFISVYVANHIICNITGMLTKTASKMIEQTLKEYCYDYCKIFYKGYRTLYFSLSQLQKIIMRYSNLH